MTKKRALDEHVAALADVAPAEFVRERNALAASLKKEDASLARAVRALPRPSPAAWALDRIARHHEAELAAYLDAADTLRAVQTGKSRSGDLGGAIRAERAARQAIVKRATEALAKAKVHVTPELRRRIGDTLLAAATGTSRTDLEEGTLRANLHPSGVPDMPFAPSIERAKPAAAKASPRPHLRLVPSPRDDREARRVERGRAQQERRRAREDARAAAAKARAEAAHARRVHGAEQALGEAEARLQAAREEVEARRAALDALKSDVSRK